MFNFQKPINQYDKVKINKVNEYLVIVAHDNTHYINYSFLSDHGLCSEYLINDVLMFKSSLRLLYYKRHIITLIKFQEVLEAAMDELYHYMFVKDGEIDPIILEKKTYLVSELSKINCLIAEM